MTLLASIGRMLRTFWHECVVADEEDLWPSRFAPMDVSLPEVPCLECVDLPARPESELCAACTQAFEAKIAELLSARPRYFFGGEATPHHIFDDKTGEEW